MIDRYVHGKLMKLLPKVDVPTVYVAPPADAEEATVDDRVRVPHLAVAQRGGNFKEVEQCVGEREALCEARRCLRCDLEFTTPQRQ
jgi:hypothetical protein